MRRGRKLKRNEDVTTISLSKESILAYIKAMANLYNIQQSVNRNSNPPARRPLVKAVLDNLNKERVKLKRKKFEDRGENTLNDGCNEDELQKINAHFRTERNNLNGCRDCLYFLISHAILSRSQTALAIEFADLFCLEIKIEIYQIVLL